MNYGHHFVFGSSNYSTAVHSVPAEGIFTPKEAQAFDQKIDDGKPATGLVIARSGVVTYVWGDPNACTTSASNTDFTGVYNTAGSAASCSFIIKTEK